MSKILVSFKDGILTIEKKNSRKDPNNIEQIQTKLLENEKEYESYITPSNINEKNKIFLMEDIASEPKHTILVYSKKGKIKYSCCTDKENMYKKLIQIKHKVLNIKLTKRKLEVKILAYIINPFNLEIENLRFYIDEILNKQCNLKQYSKNIKIEEGNIQTFKFDIEDILQDKSVVNGQVRFCFNIDEMEINYNIRIKEKKIKHNNKYYYVPMKSVYAKNFAIHIRRSYTGNLVLVKRKMETIEKTLRFKIFENKIISYIFYNIGKRLTMRRRKKINLFYEKFSEKAEEGIFELCKECEQSKNIKNYFVIDKNSQDYNKIKKYKNVIKKYSLKYYWLFYNTTCFISSDMPIHLNILRSNNKYFRKAIYDKKFVFLQHGITYLKCHGKNSPYIKGKEGEFKYIVVGSEKEKDVVVDMLKCDEEQILKTGLPIFSKIEYKHINQQSQDTVAVMLTWKPYEEQLYNFEESSYYKSVIEIYEILKKYIDKDKIIIIGHPKVNEKLENTDLNKILWKEPISKALERTKMLITDYSSVCYNAFYQGAGVVFYQNDLEKYEMENGHLIPNDDEYIGRRAFNINELENIIKDTIKNESIQLNKIRTKKFEENYKTINEFTDGKNIERIYGKLVKLKLV